MKTTCTRPAWASWLLLLSLLLVSVRGWGQSNISVGGGAVTQNFNSLGTSTTAALPSNWKVSKSATERATGNYGTAGSNVEQAGANNMSTSAANGIYRFNANGSTSESAIGGLSSSSASKSVFLYTSLVNNAADPIAAFTISYAVEKFRKGSNAAGFTIELFYSTNGTSWVSCGPTFTTSFTADADNTGYTPAPGSTVNVSGTYTPASNVAQSGQIYFAWRYSVTTGSTTSNAQALGVDDISITAVGLPTISSPSPASLTGFSTTQGTPSLAQQFSVSGSSLTDDLVVTAPSGFEVRESGVGAYDGSVSFTPSGGVVDPKTIDVRLTGTNVGTFSGDVTITSDGASGQNVAVDGTVVPSGAPLLQVAYDGEGLDFGDVCTNATSSGQTFTITGTDLTSADVTVGPLSGYLFQDVTGGGSYQSALSIAQPGGSFSRTVSVQLAPTAVQSYDGNVPVGGGGASSVDVPVTGNGVDSAPSVSTGASSDLTATSATLGGTIDEEGCTAITGYGIEYSTTDGFSNGSGTQVPGSGLSGGAFTSTLSGLTGCTTYYYKAYATNDGGTTYGSQGSFTTNAVGIPTASAATDVGEDGFTANWSVVAGATGYRLDVSTSPTFGTATPATDLFISEYVEGSSNNKYVEIFNGTGATVDLSDYRLRLYTNGSSSATGGNDVQLSGMLADGATIVYKNSSASVYAGAATNNSAVNYNGDDAIALFRISTNANVDIFGRIGEDPGAAWSSGGFSTVDQTLVRKSSVPGGVTVNPPSGFPTLTTEWDLFDTDDVSHLGAHAFNSFSPSFVPGYEDLAASGTSQPVTGLSGGTTYHYRVRAVGGSCTSDDSNVIDVTTVTPCEPVAITNITSNSPICEGEVLTLEVTVSGSEPILYEWTGTGSITGDEEASASVTGAATGDYHITVMNDCGDDEADVPVVVNSPTLWYADADGDGFGDPAVSQSACEQPDGYVADNTDGCPDDGDKASPGACGCGVEDVPTTYYADADGDGAGDPDDPIAGFTCIVPDGYVANNTDGCPDDGDKTSPGGCGCGVEDVPTTYYADTDGDGAGDPDDPIAGFTCIVPDGYVADNTDGCPDDGDKTSPGACGCGVEDVDTDDDGTLDCFDGCPTDPLKQAPGTCGCGVSDDDEDLDGTPDCVDGCPNDPDKIAPGSCGCGNPEPGTTCDDGDDNTGNDVITEGCVCAGEVIDCLGEIGGTTLPGTACDDGDPMTFGDIWTNECDCVGGPVDCNDGDPCTYDFFNGATCVNEPATDIDEDGTCDLLDECPEDPNKIAAGECGCGVADTDTDNDGTPDCNDGCADDPLKVNPGQCGCGVVDVDTDGDLFADCIDACPTDPDKIAPGACGCGMPETDTDADGTADCVDGCPNDPGKVAPGLCGCGTPDTDTDGDSTPDCNDGCPEDANKVAPGGCGCGVADTDSDSDGTPDCNDTCPTVPGVMGSTCDDGDDSTINDVLNAECACAGTPSDPCDGNNLAVVMTTDAHGEQTSWEIVPQAGGDPLCTGSVLPSNTTITTPCCVPDGCYVLHVFDSFGDGMTTGGYLLRDGDNERLIDNAGNGQFGSSSQILNNNGFCLPTGPDRMAASSCDQMELNNASILHCEPNPAVSAEWLHGNQNDDGYEFHIFDPNGTYSRKMFVANSNPNVGGPYGNTRASYLRISAMVTNPVPQFKLLNVRVRSAVNGVYSNYGPVCRLMLDPSNACQTTQLTTTPTPVVSCGATNVVVPGDEIYANEVPGATTYKFEFTAPGYLRNITSPTRKLKLGNWYTLPLSCGTTYNVRVRVSMDNGLSYCAFGAACQMTTAPCSRPAARVSEAVAEADLKLWPNPNQGDQLYVTMHGLDAALTTVSLDVIDLTGRRVMGSTVPVANGELNTVLQLQEDVGSGVYLVHVTAGKTDLVQRLVVQR